MRLGPVTRAASTHAAVQVELVVGGYVAERGYCRHSCCPSRWWSLAPGHLGQSTQIVPFEMVDAALAQTEVMSPLVV